MSFEILSLLLTLFLGRPYIASTLEPDQLPEDPIAAVEPLVVKLDSVDCTTLVEYITAARLCGTSAPQMSDSAYCAVLQSLRYRQGIRGNYATRKHYFREWIEDAESQGLLTDITAQLPCSQPLQKDIHFMSRHPQSYPQLNVSSTLVDSICAVENKLSADTIHFVAVEDIPKIYSLLQHGDIIAFLTSIEGLDVQHVGFVWKPEKEELPYLYHASSAQKRVCIDRRTIGDYAKSQKSIMGIQVVRL